MRLRKPRARATACALILLTLQGCASASGGDFCALYQPVYTADADTEETKRQADGNNAVWLALCGGREGKSDGK
jgi:hypothetical protein